MLRKFKFTPRRVKNIVLNFNTNSISIQKLFRYKNINIIDLLGMHFSRFIFILTNWFNAIWADSF